MCGIVGYVSSPKTPSSAELIKKMCAVIKHRGPDSAGEWLNSDIALGHTRLSIIDVSEAGNQPMRSESGRYMISYNGEIYNYKELRSELEGRGYRHKTQTDTEVLLNAFIEWKEKCLCKLNGMFAFAVYDTQEKNLFLARDRYGIKPLYIYNSNNIFAFASEQKALLAHPEIIGELDKEGFVEYLSFQNFITTKTLLKNIEILNAGSFQIYNIDTTHKVNHKYWEFDFQEPQFTVTENDYISELSLLVRNAVNRQLVSDVEIGSYLSGGVDSAAITSLATEKLGNLKTFTCGFDMASASGIELNFDERATAEIISGILGTEQYEVVLKSGDMERCFDKLTYHLEEPRVGQSYPNYYASKLASKFVKVVLSGVGGDELFAGYPWRYFVSQSADNYTDNYFDYWNRLIPSSEINKLLDSIEIKDLMDYPKEVFMDKLGHEKPKSSEDMVNRSLTFEAQTFLHGLLVVEDKISMSHGLESRVPFLDNELVDFAMQCPVNLKLSNIHSRVKINENDPDSKKAKYFNQTNDGKKILRKSLGGVLPENIINLKKQGFSAPDASWFKGSSIDFVKNQILNPRNRIFNILNYEQVESTLSIHFEGIENRRLFIWSILSLNNYFERNNL